jgi:TolB-like protein
MTDRASPLVILFRELVRRRVFHAVVVYGGVGFLLLEATGNLTDALGLPEPLQFAVAVAVLVGFPVTVVLAWMYERTPEGLRRAAPARLGRGLRRTVTSALVFFTALLSLGLYYMVRNGDPPGPEDPGEEPVRIDERGPVLAVLPFEAVGAEDAGHLASALEAQVETVLQESEGLTLRWRRALRPLLDDGLPVDSIGRRLDVDYFIQAQVTALGSNPSVVVQLVDARDVSVVGSAKVAAEGTDPVALLEPLTRQVEDILRPALGRHVRLRTWQAETNDTLAYRLRWQAHDRRLAALSLPGRDAVRELEGADSLLARAADLDARWRDPLLARARFAVDHALLLMRIDSMAALPAVFDRGLAAAQRALALKPGDPTALALRGRLLWRRARILPDEPGREDRIDQAERDLRLALDQDPENAVAATTLSELLSVHRSRWDQAFQFGERAYRLDAYQDDWGQIIDNTARSALEMEEDATALRWCMEGVSRRPGNPGFHACALEVMAWGDLPPRPEEAWRHFDAIVAAVPPLEAHYRFHVAGVLARAELTDSAQAVLRQALASAGRTAGPAPLWLEAGVRYRLGEDREAELLLEALTRDYPQDAALQKSRRVLRDYITRLPG